LQGLSVRFRGDIYIPGDFGAWLEDNVVVTDERLATYQSQFEELFSKEIVTFNDLLREHNLPVIYVAER
jgi:hypothetical protein